VLRLLRQVSLRQLREGWARTALVAGGIATGVSLIVAIEIINASILENLRGTIDAVAGPAALEVTLGVGELGFDEALVETVRADPDVVAAVPIVRGTVSLADEAGATLQLFGVDLAAEDDLDRYRIALVTDRRDALRAIEDPTSIFVTSAFAAARGLSLGGTVALAMPAGVGRFTIRGLLAPEGFAQAFGDRLAFMDLPAAQMALGKTQIDQIDVILGSGADTDRVAERLRTALPALDVARPAQRGALYERAFSSFQAMLTGLSLICLVAGAYIVYSTTSTAAVHRALVIAGLRLIGASSRRLFVLLLAEAAVVGLVGSVLGVAIGVVLARFLVGLVSDSFGLIFQLTLPLGTFPVHARSHALIVVAGTVTAVAGSWFAARHVTTLDPLDVSRADATALAVRPRLSRLLLWWFGLMAVSVAALVLEVQRQSIAWGNFGSTLWNASIPVVAVPLVMGAARIVTPLLSRLGGVVGRVAAESLFRSATRTGITVAAVALVMAISLTVSSLTVSFRRSFTRYFDEGVLPGDLVVAAVATPGGWLESPVSEDVVAEVRALPGIRAVDAMHALLGQPFRGERVMVLAMDEAFFDVAHWGPRWYREGDAHAAAEAVRAGRAVNVSHGLANRFGVHAGDRISLDSPTGPVDLEVAGVVDDFMSERGNIIMSRRLVAERWRDPRVTRLHVFLSPGTTVEAARAAITDAVGRRYRLKVLDMDQVIEYHAVRVERAFAFTQAIQLLVVIVTVAGILDLLLSAIWERRRELAVWRVMGAEAAVVRRAVVIESLAIGVLGVLLGVAGGFVTAWIWVGINFRYLLGYHLEFHFAVGSAVFSAALVLAMTAVAGWAAARQASRQEVLAGIQTE
jgi:putative ABC transport system permease protein